MKALGKVFKFFLPKKISEDEVHKAYSILRFKIKVKNIKKEKEKKIRANYGDVIEKIRNNIKEGKKVKVLFLIRENQKWTYDFLYKKMLTSDLFEPVIVVSALDPIAKGCNARKLSLKHNCEFFKKFGYKVEPGFDEAKNEYIDLKIYTPDIVFYDQLWELPEIHAPMKVSEFALTCYSSYGYEICDFKSNYTFYFHRLLFHYFVEHPSNIRRYEKIRRGNAKNCIAVGYPKLDVYLERPPLGQCPFWKEPKKFKIIYAPHHSLDNGWGLKCATFRENGRFILELARQHPETTWVFKPHPRLKHSLLINGVMTKSEIEEYYTEWNEIGSIYEDGNYFDLFRSSDLMITDCSSFRAEYLPTLKPTICLIKKDAYKHNFIGKKVMSVLYQVHNNNELERIFKLLVQDKQDPLLEKRKKVADEILNFGISSSDLILDVLKRDIGLK